MTRQYTLAGVINYPHPDKWTDLHSTELTEAGQAHACHLGWAALTSLPPGSITLLSVLITQLRLHPMNRYRFGHVCNSCQVRDKLFFEGGVYNFMSRCEVVPCICKTIV